MNESIMLKINMLYRRPDGRAIDELILHLKKTFDLVCVSINNTFLTSSLA